MNTKSKFSTEARRSTLIEKFNKLFNDYENINNIIITNNYKFYAEYPEELKQLISDADSELILFINELTLYHTNI